MSQLRVALIALTLALGTPLLAHGASAPYLVKDINPQPSGIGVAETGAVGDTVFFAGNDGVHGVELWKSDGTA
jgi:hypothetical protein